ncbi:hypothetical protein V8F20_006245 [Naviculisporaceae sp. PSN 640]
MKITGVLSLLPAFVAAVPNVTVIPLGSKDCSSYPGLIRTPAADITGYLRFEVTNSDDPAIDGLLATTKIQRWPTFQNLSATVTTLVMDVRKSTRLAKPVFRCFNGALEIVGDGDPKITVSKDWRGAQMMLGDYQGGPGYKLEPYAHEIDGVRQEGVFVGANGKTTWGFGWERPSQEDCVNGNSGLDWYSARLQGLEYDPSVESRAWGPVEFEGFIKVFQY